MSQPNFSVLRTTKQLQRQVITALPLKLQPLARFGMQALVFTPFVSCNSNARLQGERQASEMRMYRLLRHESVGELLMRTLRQQLPLTTRSALNLDFSNFGGVAALVAALQTNHGRAIPWAFETLVSNTQGFRSDHPYYERRKAAYREWKQVSGGDQHDIVLRLIQQIDASSATISPPKIVCDRGFGNSRILRCLFGRSGMSYVRLRDDFQVSIVDGSTCRADALPKGSYRVQWQGLEFRVAVVTTGKTAVTPWIISTNDGVSSLQQIAKLYYHRFEIEETFRDWKSCFGFGKSRFRRWQSLAVILSFASLGICLAWRSRKAARKHQAQPPIHPKQTLSFVRLWQEAIQSSLRRPGLRYLTG